MSPRRSGVIIGVVTFALGAAAGPLLAQSRIQPPKQTIATSRVPVRRQSHTEPDTAHVSSPNTFQTSGQSLASCPGKAIVHGSFDVGGITHVKAEWTFTDGGPKVDTTVVTRVGANTRNRNDLQVSIPITQSRNTKMVLTVTGPSNSIATDSAYFVANCP